MSNHSEYLKTSKKDPVRLQVRISSKEKINFQSENINNAHSLLNII